MKSTSNEEKHKIKYLDDLIVEATNYLNQVVLNVFDGVAVNINQSDKRLQKAILNFFKKTAYKLKGFLGRRRDINKPFVVSGLHIYKKGKPVTIKEWETFVKQVELYMKPFLSDLSEEISVKGILLGMATAEAESQKDLIDRFGFKTLEKLEKERFAGYIPDSAESAKKRFKIDKSTERAIVEGYNRIGEFINEARQNVLAAIKEQIKEGYKLAKTPDQLAADLYSINKTDDFLKNYTAQSIFRDWKRVAHTEITTLHNNGKLSFEEKSARESLKNNKNGVYYIFTGGTCPECRRRQGKIARLIPLEEVKDEANDKLSLYGINDNYTDTAIWVGKNNIGVRKENWRLCVPLHPYNTANLQRYFPEFQEYRDGKVRYKSKIKVPESTVILEENAKQKALEEQKIADREKGIHKKNIDYIEMNDSRIIGKDESGRSIAEFDGIKYISVNPEDFKKELTRYRGNPLLPIPVATNQKEHKKIFI